MCFLSYTIDSIQSMSIDFPFQLVSLILLLIFFHHYLFLCLSNVCRIPSLIVHANYCNFLMHFLSVLIIVVNFLFQIMSINFSLPLIIVYQLHFSIICW